MTTTTRNMANKNQRPTNTRSKDAKKTTTQVITATTPTTTKKKPTVSSSRSASSSSKARGARNSNSNSNKIIPTKLDAVFGRGRKKTHVRTGSLYRELVESHWMEYSTLPPNEFALRRDWVQNNIISVIAANGGRFIYRDGPVNILLDTSDQKDRRLILKKIQRALFNERKRVESRMDVPVSVAMPTPKTSNKTVRAVVEDDSSFHDDESLEEEASPARSFMVSNIKTIHEEEEEEEDDDEDVVEGVVQETVSNLQQAMDSEEDSMSSEWEVKTQAEDKEEDMDLEEPPAMVEQPPMSDLSASSVGTFGDASVGTSGSRRRDSIKLEALAALASELLVLDEDISEATPPPTTLTSRASAVVTPTAMEELATSPSVVPLKKRQARCGSYSGLEKMFGAQSQQPVLNSFKFNQPALDMPYTPRAGAFQQWQVQQNLAPVQQNLTPLRAPFAGKVFPWY